MNAKLVYTLTVSASLSLMAASGVEEFPSVEKAMIGFATNSVAARERVYRYVAERAKSMNGLNAKTILTAMKTAAVALNRATDYDAMCDAGLSSPDESVRFACATALLQSPTLMATPSNLTVKVERLLEKPGALLPTHWSEIFRAKSYALADLAVGRKDTKAAGELLLAVIRKVDPVPAGIARRLLDANADEQALDAAVSALRTRLAEMPLGDAAAFRTAVEKVQPEIIELLNRLGRCDEALAECRVLVLLSSPRSYQAAVNQTAPSLKRADGNLGRATAFMNFQKKGLVPKERNILLDAPQLSDGVRAEARKSLPVGKSEVWGESLAVSARLIWLDDPVAAVREAMRAFGLAPFDNKSLQACADAMMQPILTVTRNPDSAKGIVDYLLHGPTGPDGAKGTQDDLPSPFEDLEPVLKLGHGN